MNQMLVTALALLASVSFGLGREARYSGLFPVEVGGKWGYIDKSGTLVIKPQFDGAASFFDGLAMVKTEGKWGYIDADGKLVIAAKFDKARSFSKGLASVVLRDSAGYGWRVIDRTGSVVISRSAEPQEFPEGLAIVWVDGKAGYKNQDGKVVIKPQFGSASDFSEGLAPIMMKGAPDKWGYVNRVGKVVIKPQYQEALSFSEGLAPVRIDGEYGYINPAGKVVINPRFEEARGFSEGLAAVFVGHPLQSTVDKGGEYGYIDKTGEMVIDPQFDEAGNFSGGLALVRVGVELNEFGPIERGRLAYIDETGKYVWPEWENVPIVPLWTVDEKPRPINIPVPMYPDSARTAGIEGRVVIRALVNVDGSIADTRVHWSSGNASLDQAAADAAMSAEFTPGLRKGSPVRVWVIVPFRFPPK